MELGLSGKVALVAGASKGLGKAIALGLAREGARVAIFSSDETRIKAAAKDIAESTGAQVVAIRANVTRAAEVQRAVDETAKTFGTVHILVTNAAGPPSGTFVTRTDAQWRSAIDMMLMSAVRLSSAALPYMQRQSWGRIIHLASYSVKHPIENLVLSNSIRAAVVALAKTQAMELAKDGILVNSVLPGWHKTERVAELMQERANRDHISVREAYASIEKEIPLGRMGNPEELANVVVFLASERASYVNGVALLVDGGLSRTAF